MEFSRQEYWSGLLCPPPGKLPDSGIEPRSPAAPALQGDSLPLSHQGSPCPHVPNKITDSVSRLTSVDIQVDGKVPLLGDVPMKVSPREVEPVLIYEYICIIFLPGKSHEEGSLVGYSPWGSKESALSEQLSTCIM